MLMKLVKGFLVFILAITNLSFADDYSPFIRVLVNDKHVGKLQGDVNQISIENYNANDTLNFIVYYDSQLPKKGKLILKGIEGQSIIIRDKDNHYNVRRLNGKKYSIPIVEFKKLAMNEMQIFHSSDLLDSLLMRPFYHGRLVLASK